MRIILSLFIVFFSAILWANDISGIYAVKTKDDESYIEIFQKNGKFYAIGFANKSGKNSGNDVKNPDPKLRNKKVSDNVFLWNLEYSGDNKYINGKLYNYQNGATYNVSAKKIDNTLELRVSKDRKGIFGKTLSWRKMSEKEIAPYKAKLPNIEALQLPK